MVLLDCHKVLSVQYGTASIKFALFLFILILKCWQYYKTKCLALCSFGLQLTNFRIIKIDKQSSG